MSMLSGKLNLDSRKRLAKCFIRSVMLYGAETRARNGLQRAWPADIQN